MNEIGKYVDIEISCECGAVEHFDDLNDAGDNVTWTCEDCGELIEVEYHGVTARMIEPPVGSEAS